MSTEWNGKNHLEYRYRRVNNLENRAEGEKLRVNSIYFEIYNREKDVYKNSWITDKLISKENVKRLVECARVRWKIENKHHNVLKNGGFVIDTLEAAFWCFLTTDNYRDAVLKAVNLGDDTDTTAAVTGSLAGLCYGVDAIPAEWREMLAGCGDIRRLAEAMARTLAVCNTKPVSSYTI
jgi:ADP-ribosylglycohydrolase